MGQVRSWWPTRARILPVHHDSYLQDVRGDYGGQEAEDPEAPQGCWRDSQKRGGRAGRQAPLEMRHAEMVTCRGRNPRDDCRQATLASSGAALSRREPVRWAASTTTCFRDSPRWPLRMAITPRQLLQPHRARFQ